MDISAWFEHLLPNQHWRVLFLIFLTLVLFVLGKRRVDVVALLILALIGLLQLLPENLLFSGLSSNAVVALIAIMIITSGLDKTGLLRLLADKISRNTSKRWLILVIGVMAGLSAALIQNIGAAMLFLPVVQRLSRRYGMSPTQLLMPMGFCALAGSQLSLIGSSPLLLLNDLLEQAAQSAPIQKLSLAPFSLFASWHVGVAALLLALIYFYCLPKKWLNPKDGVKDTLMDLSYLQQTYGVGGEVYEVSLPKEHAWASLSLKEVEKQLDARLAIIALSEGKQVSIPPLKRLMLTETTRLAIVGPLEVVESFCLLQGLILHPRLQQFAEKLHGAQGGFAEMILPPGSPWIGRLLKDLHFRQQWRLQILAVHRGRRIRVGRALRKVALKSGDTLCVYGDWTAVHELSVQRDNVVVTSDYPQETLRPHKIKAAVCILAFSLLLAVTIDLSAPIVLWIGAVGMIYFGVLTIDEAYEAVNWKAIFLLVGLIPLGLAMHSSGTGQWLTSLILPLVGDWPHWVLQLSLAITATLLCITISHIGTTILLVPLAINIAFATGADPRIFALTVALCASNGFLLPIHPVCALVASAGHYGTRDFLRVGLGMSVLYLLAVMLFL